MKLNVTTLLLTLLIPISLSGPAVAGHHEKEAANDPLAAAAEFPLLLRRTTLIVRDIEASLKLYRDGLGREVIYDQEINRPTLQRIANSGCDSSSSRPRTITLGSSG